MKLSAVATGWSELSTLHMIISKLPPLPIPPYSHLLNWTHLGIIRNGVDLHPMGFLLDVIFHFCPPMGTFKTMVFHLSTSWVLLGPWFSVFPENSQAGSTVQKHVWYY